MKNYYNYYNYYNAIYFHITATERGFQVGSAERGTNWNISRQHQESRQKKKKYTSNKWTQGKSKVDIDQRYLTQMTKKGKVRPNLSIVQDITDYN